jgi:hypothetical protein
MKLHIGPQEMGRMFFYDIMLLYKRYEDYVEEEDRQQKEEQKKYEEENGSVQDMQSNMQSSMNQMTQKMGSFDAGRLTSGFTMPSMPHF